jgi:hypothetical protein
MENTMPRVTTPKVLLALSPTATATALGLHTDVIAEAIRDRKLIVRQVGAKRRIWVGDIEQFFKSLPEATKRRSRDV